MLSFLRPHTNSQNGAIKLTKELVAYSVILLIIIAAGFYIFFYSRTQILGSLSDTRTLTYEQAINDPVLSKANMLVAFPEGESVTTGEIKDKETLEKYQAYFKKATIGQTLIIFSNKTIIYDPRTDSIVDIANVKLY